MKPKITITQISGVADKNDSRQYPVYFGSNRRDAAKYLRSLRQVKRGFSPKMIITVEHS
jgi:hypothetical protein